MQDQIKKSIIKKVIWIIKRLQEAYQKILNNRVYDYSYLFIIVKKYI